MATHVTLYLEDQPAEELRRLMAMHSCSATAAVELLLRRAHPVQGASAPPTMPADEPTRLAVA